MGRPKAANRDWSYNFIIWTPILRTLRSGSPFHSINPSLEGSFENIKTRFSILVL